MEIVKKYGNNIWRIPLISILGGLCYDPVYIKILMRFGISESGELNRIATLWASGGLLLAVLLLGLMKQDGQAVYFKADKKLAEELAGYIKQNGTK